MANLFRGTFTAMITPMNEDGSVDYEGFRSNVKFQLENGVTGEGISGKIVFNGNISGVSTFNTTDVENSRNIEINGNGKSDIGGIIYKYKSIKQENTLEIKNVEDKIYKEICDVVKR